MLRAHPMPQPARAHPARGRGVLARRDVPAQASGKGPVLTAPAWHGLLAHVVQPRGTQGRRDALPGRRGQRRGPGRGVGGCRWPHCHGRVFACDQAPPAAPREGPLRLCGDGLARQRALRPALRPGRPPRCDGRPAGTRGSLDAPGAASPGTLGPVHGGRHLLAPRGPRPGLARGWGARGARRRLVRGR